MGDGLPNPSFPPDNQTTHQRQVTTDHRTPRDRWAVDSSPRESDSIPEGASHPKDNTRLDGPPPGGLNECSIPVAEEDKEDYSLSSYLKQLSCYKALEGQVKSLFQNIDFSKIFRKILLSFLVVSYLLYFGAALILHSKTQEPKDYWCHGDGFLVVVSSIAFIMLLYFQILKPRFGKKIARWWGSNSAQNTTLQKILNLSNLWYGKLFCYFCTILTLVIFVLVDSKGDHLRLTSLFGIVVLIFLSFLFSTAPRRVIWKQVLWGLTLQFVLGIIILRWSVGQAVFSCMGSKIQNLLAFTDSGSEFVYGKLVTELNVFAFKVLSVIFFFSFCIEILYYYGIMQWIVIKLGWLLQVTIGTTACESVTAAANIFLGMTTAPLLVKPMLPKMTMSELHAVLTGGFATIAGAGMSAYISFGVDSSHLLSASFMSAPAALGVSKLFYPELEVSQTTTKDIEIKRGQKKLVNQPGRRDCLKLGLSPSNRQIWPQANVLHAACEGVASSISLVTTIIVNLIAIIAFLALIDALLNWTCLLIGVDDQACSLSNIFGYAFMPLAWVMGVPWQDCYLVGQLLGTKTIVNEFIAYIHLTEHVKKEEILKRSEVIATYALCGFSNIGSIGIQLGGLGAIAPERRGDLAKIGVRSMIAGSVACFLTACVAGSLLDAVGDGVATGNSTAAI